MKIYTYAIIDYHERIDERLEALFGARVYCIPYDDMAIVASDFDCEIRDITRDLVLEHEEVMERLMSESSVLPMRFLTVFHRKQDVLRLMEEYHNDFRENLNRLRGKVEFGIKVIWPGDAIAKRIVDADRKGNSRACVSACSPGKIFLEERLREYRIRKRLEEEAEKCIAAVDRFFNGLAAEKKLEKLKTINLLLHGAYLVEQQKQGDFKRAFKRLKSARDDLKYLLSGPWAPYNFVVLTKRNTPRDSSIGAMCCRESSCQAIAGKYLRN